ncbi:hypothetical protein [Flavobacterium sp. ACAM 123]|jgi:hypothetical protein|uniref:hypothetical protein n=1 Tax=Flavobacterium sp. ACAM 123 TaxID=1189620 RepID=UPI0002FA3237|nr:hypothetical protein [Flavobacterium sp. ACAM 123]
MKNMKNMRTIIIISIIYFINCSFIGRNLPPPLDNHQDIIGKWQSDETSGWVLEFKADGKCEESLNGKILKVYFYSFGKTSPQCGHIVPVGELFEYLNLVNVNNSEDKFCYEFLGVDNDNFAMIYIGGASNNPMGFIKL